MKTQRQEVFQQIAANEDLWAEIKQRLSPAGGDEWMGIAKEMPSPAPGIDFEFAPMDPDEMERLRETPEDLFAPENLRTEAIVRRLGRPVNLWL